METKATPTIITTSFIGQQGQMLFYLPLYGNRGALSGILRVDPAVLNAPAGLFNGSFTITGATIAANHVAPCYGQSVSIVTPTTDTTRGYGFFLLPTVPVSPTDRLNLSKTEWQGDLYGTVTRFSQPNLRLPSNQARTRHLSALSPDSEVRGAREAQRLDCSRLSLPGLAS